MEDSIDTSPIKSRFNSIYPCIEQGCKAVFSRPSRLKTHALSHTGERPLHCELCEKSFTRNAHLKRHVLINHQGQRTPSQQIDCDQCSGTFANKYSLKKHVNKHHLVKQYACSDCDLKFHKHHLLRSHQSEHSGHLPWTCDQCPKSFQYQMYLKRHRRIHHKSYSCQDCDAVLIRWSDLQQHKAAEHPTKKVTDAIFPCDECEKTFRENHILQRHKEVHKETRDVLQCPKEFCHRYFYFQYGLSAHIKSYHEGQKYYCLEKDCSEKFYSKQRLKHHIKLLHSDLTAPLPKKPPKGEQRRRRKDKGKIKKPMAQSLSGIVIDSQTEVKNVLNGETKGLDDIETIEEEVNSFINNSSELASEEEIFVGCRRKAGTKNSGGNLVGLMKRPGTKHFSKMWQMESDTDTTDIDDVSFSLPEIKPKIIVDFSRFVKHT